MAQANAHITLSEIARDPVVAAFLRRGEGDKGELAVPSKPAPILTGGCAKQVEEA